MGMVTTPRTKVPGQTQEQQLDIPGPAEASASRERSARFSFNSSDDTAARQSALAYSAGDHERGSVANKPLRPRLPPSRHRPLHKKQSMNQRHEGGSSCGRVIRM